jgi:hypothetical protein
MFLADNFVTTAKLCAMKHSIPIQRLLDCADGSLGDELLFQAGKKTQALLPKPTYIPHLVFDNAHYDKLQKEAEFDLKNFLCRNVKDGTRSSKICI